MKKTLAVISLAFSIFIISPIFLLNTKAAEIKNNEQSIIVNEYIDDDLYISSGTVSIKDDINGDLIAFGGQITVEDDIYGDVVAFGGTISLQGDVRGNIICAGGQIAVDGNVNEDIYVAGGQITINGNVTDDVRAAGGNVNVNSNEIGGDLIVRAGNVNISEDTVIDGDQEINTSETEKPSTQFNIINRIKQKGATGVILSLLRKIGILAGWLIVGLLLYKFIPVKSRQITNLLSDKKSTAKSLLIGFAFELAILLLTPLIILLIFLGVGQPVFQLGSLLLSTAVTISGLYCSTAITKMLIQSTKKKDYDKYIIPMLIGVTVYQVIGWIPCCIGFTAKVIITTWGLGGILLNKWNHIQASKKNYKK